MEHKLYFWFMYVCVCVYVHAYVSLCVHMCIIMHICSCVCMLLCMCGGEHMCTYTKRDAGDQTFIPDARQALS